MRSLTEQARELLGSGYTRGQVLHRLAQDHNYSSVKSAVRRAHLPRGVYRRGPRTGPSRPEIAAAKRLERLRGLLAQGLTRPQAARRMRTTLAAVNGMLQRARAREGLVVRRKAGGGT